MGGVERRGPLRKDLPSRFCRGAPPPPAGRGQPLKGEGGEGGGPRNRDSSAAVQARGLRAARSPSLLRPPSPPSSGRRVRAGT